MGLIWRHYKLCRTSFRYSNFCSLLSVKSTIRGQKRFNAQQLNVLWLLFPCYRFDSSITKKERKSIDDIIKTSKNFLQTVENLLNPLQNTQKWYIFAIFAILKAKNRFLVESAMRNIFYNSKSIWEHLDLGNSSVVWIICMRVRITALSEILNFPTISWFLRKFSFGLCRIQFWRWIFRHICIDIVIHIWLFGVNK